MFVVNTRSTYPRTEGYQHEFATLLQRVTGVDFYALYTNQYTFCIIVDLPQISSVGQMQTNMHSEFLINFHIYKPKLARRRQLHHNLTIRRYYLLLFIIFCFMGSHLLFPLTSLVLSLSPFLTPFLHFSLSPSSMLNENQTFSRPNQDVLSWMSLIMGWVNSEFRCCRGIESQDKPGLLERNNTDMAQWTQDFSGLPQKKKIVKGWVLVNTGYHNSIRALLFFYY